VPDTPAAPRRTRRPLPLRPADLRGLARLGIDGVVGVTDVVEAMHHAIVSLPAPAGPVPPGRPGGITGLVYRSVRGTTRAVGRGLEALLGALPLDTTRSSPERELFIAALNGVFGDHLADTGNPLAIDMQWRSAGRPWRPGAGANASAPTGRLLVLVHGLAMNDLQWSRRGHDHGRALARELGYTPVYLHYNSGRHISQNGRDFAARLDRLVSDWPVPVSELAIIGHSMGGLVTRSACHQGAGQAWTQALTRLVFMGTPHHGAPLERGGRLVDALLDISPYAAPLARLGRSRSAGITDLRFGNLLDADWQQPRGRQAGDTRQPVPLPPSAATFLVAATTAEHAASLRSAMLGDGLVPVASALGEHADPALALHVPAQRRLVVTSANHWDLLDRPQVYAQLRDWLR
jgi:PGAP1-like protein